MEPNAATEQKALLKSIRQRRAELREAMSALELALAAPSAGDPGRWAERVRSALADLTAAFDEHIELTEGDDGLYREVLDSAPRLSDAVAHLTSEHVAIRDQLEDLLSPDVTRDAGEIRVLGTSLLGRLVRHRQRGSELVYQAYEVDIGGDT